MVDAVHVPHAEVEEGGGPGIRTSPGDYIFVPPYVPHCEENPNLDDEAIVVIARSTQEAVVANLPELYVRDNEPGTD